MNFYIRTIADWAVSIATDVYDALDVNEQIDFLTTYFNADMLMDMIEEVLDDEIGGGKLKDVITLELLDKREEIYQVVKEIVKDIERQRAEN